jgi:hypothetical protein
MAMMGLKRWLSWITTAFSLTLCAITCVLWVRSYHVSDALRYRKAMDHAFPLHARTALLYSGAGAVQLGWGTGVHYAAEDTPSPSIWSYVCERDPEHPSKTAINSGWKHSFPGFGVLSDSKQGPPMSNLPYLGDLFVPVGYQWQRSTWAMWAPHWFLALLLSALPMRQLHRWLTVRRRRKGGLCLTCGYDLRGTVERCPECGEIGCAATGETPVLQSSSGQAR